MKKIIGILLIFLLGNFLVSCDNSTKPEIPGNGEYNYGADEVMLNIWDDKVIYNETVVLEDKGTEISGNLLYKPTRIISVRDYTLNKEYNKDEYEIKENKIIRTNNSTIPYLTSDQLAGKNLPEGFGLDTYQAKKPGTEIVFTEGVGIIMHQIAISYEHNGVWNAVKPKNQKELFPNTLKKLKNNKPLTVVANGDSIFTGANSSAILGIDPYQDDFINLFINKLKQDSESKINLINTSLGGMMSKWGKDNVDPNINAYNPDLVIIGFGMNDGSMSVANHVYLDNIEFMIKSIKARNSNAEIIIVSTILANPLSIQNMNQMDYLPGLEEITEKYQVGLLDMSSISNELYKTKKGVDILANNINHPSDFLVRIYGSGLYRILKEK